jgi:hypothetical protein
MGRTETSLPCPERHAAHSYDETRADSRDGSRANVAMLSAASPCFKKVFGHKDSSPGKRSAVTKRSKQVDCVTRARYATTIVHDGSRVDLIDASAGLADIPVRELERLRNLHNPNGLILQWHHQHSSVALHLLGRNTLRQQSDTKVQNGETG